MNIGKVAAGTAALAGAILALSAQGAGATTAVAGTTVNLRQGPGTSYTVVSKIPGGSSVDVSGCQNGWCQVTFQGQNGYVVASGIGQGPAMPPGSPPPGYVAPPPGYYDQPVYGPPPGYYYGGYYGPCCYYGGWRGGWGGGWGGRRW